MQQRTENHINQKALTFKFIVLTGYTLRTTDDDRLNCILCRVWCIFDLHSVIVKRRKRRCTWTLPAGKQQQ